MEQFQVTGDLNKSSLAHAVSVRTGLTRAQAEAAVHMTLDTIAKALTNGHAVTVTNFGSWTPVIRAARTGWNPAIGQPMSVPEKFRVKWATSPKLHAMVNGDAPADISKDPSS